jgi:hypothetical protein
VASVVAVVGMLWGSVTPARACSCLQRSTQEYVQAADLIVVGELISFYLDMDDAMIRAEDRGRSDSSVGQRYPVRATLAIDRYLVGDGPTHLRVADHGACTAFYREYVGQNHLLFLEEDSGWLVTGACYGSGVGTGASRAEVEAITGPGSPPTYRGLLPDVDRDNFPLFPAVAVAVIGPLAFLLGAAFWSRRGV